MAEVINLRRARKARERADEERRAAENRVRYGRPKAEKRLKDARAEKERRDLEGKRRDPGDPPPASRDAPDPEG